MSRTISYTLPTGHTAAIAVNRWQATDGPRYAFTALVQDQLGTSLTLAYGAHAPTARLAFKICDGAVRQFRTRALLAVTFGEVGVYPHGDFDCCADPFTYAHEEI